MSQHHVAGPQSSCPAPACRKATPAPDLAARNAALSAALTGLVEAATDAANTLESYTPISGFSRRHFLEVIEQVRAALAAADAVNTEGDK